MIWNKISEVVAYERYNVQRNLSNLDALGLGPQIASVLILEVVKSIFAVSTLR